ncbi:MAG TPA: hypothetical protein VKS79_02990 [Gemmataceae bacterium]|nr:hypothetical protein [Gemmataceae bacterium]
MFTSAFAGLILLFNNGIPFPGEIEITLALVRWPALAHGLTGPGNCVPKEVKVLSSLSVFAPLGQEAKGQATSGQVTLSVSAIVTRIGANEVWLDVRAGHQDRKKCDSSECHSTFFSEWGKARCFCGSQSDGDYVYALAVTARHSQHIVSQRENPRSDNSLNLHDSPEKGQALASTCEDAPGPTATFGLLYPDRLRFAGPFTFLPRQFMRGWWEVEEEIVFLILNPALAEIIPGLYKAFEYEQQELQQIKCFGICIEPEPDGHMLSGDNAEVTREWWESLNHAPWDIFGTKPCPSARFFRQPAQFFVKPFPTSPR